jgi:tetratricopeptide (TPR) repeat protein
MQIRDGYGLALTAGEDAAAAYNRGIDRVLRMRSGAVDSVAMAITLDPTFALGHAALALFGHELCAQVDVDARLRDAQLHARRSTERERSHVHAIVEHIRGNSAPLVSHLETYPRDALLLSTAVPTIAFAGVTSVPEEAWEIVERAAPAYGNDWWYAGLLAFMRQEQGLFDEAMDLACSSLAVQPDAGHSAHARAHAHYETGDHLRGLSWMDEWVMGDGAATDSLSHFSWHAALHELSLGDLDAVRARYQGQLRPEYGLGCRALVDTGSLLWRWALTPGADDVPAMEEVTRAVNDGSLSRPATPFLGMHAAVALLALDDAAGLERLATWAESHRDRTHAEVVAPLARAMKLMAEGNCSAAADRLAALGPQVWRLGGSDAQREVVEETRIAALLRAGRYDEAREVLDRRLDRRHCRRDEAWLADCTPA